MATKRDRSNYLIQSVAHSLEVLEALSKSESEMGITELSKLLGLHKNNVFRLLATLGLRGYVQQNPVTEAYSLGPACLKMGQAYLLNCDLVTRVRPYIRELNQEIKETVSFARLINQEVHFPISISSGRSVSVMQRQGITIPAGECSVGKLLIAQDSNSEEYISTLTPATRKDISQMNGISSCFETEEDPDVLTVCMLARGIGNSVIGAIEVMAPSFRAKQEELMPKISECVNQINECFAADQASLVDKIEKDITTGSESGIGVSATR